MSQKVDISIVILNYNSLEYLKGCLSSIDKSKLGGISIETIVVDNASSDDSAKVIASKYPKIKLIASKKNTGFAGGNNLARRLAKGNFVLFLNPDTVLEPNVLAGVYKFMKKNKDVGAATCRLELASKELDYSCHRGYPTPFNAFFYFSGITKLFPRSKLF